MRLGVLGFLAGIVALQLCAELPAVRVLVLALAAGGVLLAWLRRPWLRPVGALLVGFAWAGLTAQHRLADALPEANEGRDVQVVGVVATLPQQFDRGVRFTFDVEQAEAEVPRKISLAWYRGVRPQEDDDVHVLPAVRPGERWRLTVRLRRPHGSLNPHGFDFEAWLFEQGMRATGYVRRSDGNARLEPLVARPGYLIERLRLLVRERLDRVLADAPYAGILVALAIGDQQSIAPPLWQDFSRTGVTHLLSVSGLHVTMVAGLGAWAVGWGWRRSSRLALHLPAQKAAALAGFVTALGYCLLAGFAVPAQRTLYMLAVVAWALWTGRIAGVSRVLALALLLVLLLDPWAVLSAGFWLSFGAVAVLFYVSTGRLGAGNWLVGWARAQWAVTIGLLPALLALFQQFSIVSPLANAVAIPVVSLLVTPLVLVGTLPPGDPFLWLAHELTAWLMSFLTWLAASPWAVWQQAAPPGWAFVLGVMGIVWMLMPRGFPVRWLGMLALVPLVLVVPERPGPGELKVTVLDVGQGLAVHLQTAEHDLLYDAGPAFSADADSGNRIVVPYLRALGVRRLDTLMISHQDKDHEGGAESVAAGIPVVGLLSSLPDDHPLSVRLPHRRCQDGEHWDWDGIGFRVLHPAEADYSSAGKSNHLSCVLLVESPGGSLLLTGDIEGSDEAALLSRHGGELPVDVVLPAHHGSRSSSTGEFVIAASPSIAVFSAGYRNRFGHPAKEVAERYRRAGSAIRRTDHEGAVVLRLGRAGIETTATREERRRYWHRP